ncbi:DUF87 domain-containing protein [Patescibacteria group bacterium]|nr:DUF87 domain-containing protein [Patescibacteria group bacterium]MBU1702801.1 DUF87 domain-containing protein [Patescibacteria group bacterium]MBU1953806.1 DUF87 domain-containing protein [Patescibacteria group bacterium]
MSLFSIFINVLLLVVGTVAVLTALELFVRLQQKRRLMRDEYTTLMIRVAKENEAGPIVAEQIFSTIHGVTRDIGFWDRLRGDTQDRISFEIASVERSIRFYAHFPSRLRNLVEGQIYAQYPNVEISEVEDYSCPSGVEVSESEAVKTEGRELKALVNIEKAIKKSEEKRFTPVEDFKNAIGIELELSNPDIFPIKRYPQFEDKKAKFSLDPLSAITSTLAKFNDPDEQAWIQVVFRPLEDKWRTIFIKCIRILNKGIYLNIAKLQTLYARAYTTRSRILRIVFFPVYWIFALQGLKSGVVNETDTGDSSVTVDEEVSRTHDRESTISGAMDKVSKLLYETNVRIVYLPKHANKEVALVKLREIAGSFKQFSIPQVNGFVIGETLYGKDIVERYNRRELRKSFVLSVEEIATVYHMPNLTVTTPNIYWVRSRRVEPPGDLPTPGNTGAEDLTVLGKTNFRGAGYTFGIKTLDRRRHIYIIGKTGMGKSTLLENMIFADIQAGKGVAVVDPHGDLADAVLNFVPSNRTNDVVVFDPSDRDFPVAFNMLENIDPSLNSIVCSGLVGIFKKIYGESWGPRLEHILRNTILSLLEYQNATMLGIPRVLQDKQFRGRVVRKINDPIVKSFWENEFEKMEPRQRIEAISPILNKVGQFLSSPIIRNILGQPKSAIDLRFAMDKGKIVIVNLSKGKIGEDTSSLLGAMMITKFQLDAMSRANIPEKERKDFYLYVDEFQNFATDSFATILSEARKYRLNLTMANQYIAQMPEEVRDAVFGNVGTIVSFQVGFDDAEYLSGQFGEEVLPNDLVSLSKYTAYSRLLIDGMPSKTFSMDSLPPPDLEPEEGRREKVIRLARERYATERAIVEDKIRRWSESGNREELPEGGRKLPGGKKPTSPK